MFGLRRKSVFADFELRVATPDETKSDWCTSVFHRFGRCRKSGFADFELRLALSKESKSDGLPVSFSLVLAAQKIWTR